MKKTIELLEQAVAEIKSVSATSFITNLKLGKTAYYVNEALAALKKYTRWETPEQYTKRTGKELPDETPVWTRLVSKHDKCAWSLGLYEEAKDSIEYSKENSLFDENTFYFDIVIATEAGCPTYEWEPEEAGDAAE